MSSENDKETSFVDPSKIDGKEDGQKKPQGEYPLFKKLDAIVEAIKEQTKADIALKEAMNALLTSFIVKSDKVEPKPQVSIPKETESKPSPELKFKVVNIAWEKRTGEKGEFELADKEKNQNVDYLELERLLETAGGSMTSEGLWYWLFRDGKAIGRKPSTGGFAKTPQQESKQQPLPKPDNSKLEEALGHTPPSQPNSKVDQVKMLFPEDLMNMLMFSEEGDGVTIKPRQFLGSENFAKIASVVRGAGGEYVSAGKASHFRIKSK